MIYDHEGILNYRLIAQYIEYFSERKISWITNPIVTTYDKDKVPTWLIRSDRARLTNDLMLYLYGHIEISALKADSQLRKITTNQAQINLVNQDIISQDHVTLYGTTFNSSALKIRGNLHSKNAELFGKVKTSYQVQKEQT